MGFVAVVADPICDDRRKRFTWEREERWKSSIIGSSLLLPIVVMRRRRASVSCTKTELIIGKMLWHIKTWHTIDNEGGKSIDLSRDDIGGKK